MIHKKKKVGNPEKYDRSLKIAVATEWLKGEKGYGTLGKEYGLSLNTVRHFVIWYKAYLEEQGNSVVVTLSETEKSDNLLLRKKLVEMERKLNEATIQVNALNITIDVAEKTFDIDIRKKSGSKQQTK